MIFYDIDGNKREFTLQEPFNRGYCGYVYKLEEELVLKVYKDSCYDSLRLNANIYKQLKEINSEHMIQINELLYQKDITQGILRFKEPTVAGYTYKYIQDDKIDILTTDTEYLVHNIAEISKLFTELSKSGIRVADLKPSNTITQKDKMVLIDPDLFSNALFKGKCLERVNQLDLLHLFKEILLDSAYYDGYGYYCGYNKDYNDSVDSCINEIFDRATKSINPIVEVIKYLQQYKYPIDAIKMHIKNRFYY